MMRFGDLGAVARTRHAQGRRADRKRLGPVREDVAAVGAPGRWSEAPRKG